MNASIDIIIFRARYVAALPSWNKTKLAEEADLGKNGLIDLPKEDFNPTLKTLRKLEAAIDRIVERENIVFPPKFVPCKPRESRAS
ncbi:MAG: hypothetical protein WBK55_08125 [Alphaproteobacteria bacterium]